MKQIKVIVLIIISVFIFSCREKKLPEDFTEANVPIFTMSANIGGLQIDLKAGNGEYYAYSNYITNLNNVPTQFSGVIKKNNCIVCPNSLEIIFKNDFAYLNNAQTYMDSVLRIGSNYKYLNSSNSNANFTVQFKASPRISFGGKIIGYLWEFGDGTTSTLQNPSHVYSADGIYSVSLTMFSDIYGSSKVTNQVKLDLGLTASKTKIIKDFWLAPNKLRFHQKTSGLAPFQYFWDFGDGTSSNDTLPVHQYAGPSKNYKVKLRVVDANADTAYAEYNTKMDSAKAILSNFTIESIVPIVNIVRTSRIIVNWTDANGILYTSDNPQQPSSSNFEVLSIEDFFLNENNQSTKKVRVKFNCKVFNGPNSLQINNAEAIISIAYK